MESLDELLLKTSKQADEQAANITRFTEYFQESEQFKALQPVVADIEKIEDKSGNVVNILKQLTDINKSLDEALGAAPVPASRMFY